MNQRDTVRYCEAFAKRGTGHGQCGRPLDEQGYCDNPRDHVDEESAR